MGPALQSLAESIEVARIFRALAHPTRVWLVLRLSRGEACVCEMLRELSISQPMLSQHLQVLRSAGIVRTRREANRSIYALRNPRFAQLVEIAERGGMVSAESYHS